VYKLESKSNLNISIERRWLEIERRLFLSFSQVVIADLLSLVAVRIQPPTGGDELIFGNSLHDPYPARLEAVLGQREASQL
jgi:hypothetical protein